MFLAVSYLVYFVLAICKPVAAGQRVLESTGALVVLASSFIFAIVCLLIVTFRPENRIGWLCGVCALTNLLVISSGHTSTCTLASAIGSIPEDARALIILDARLHAIIASALHDYAEAAARRRHLVIATLSIEALDEQRPEPVLRRTEIAC